jgi:hypothetical protein
MQRGPGRGLSALLVLAVACSGGDASGPGGPPPGPAPVASVTVTPAQVQVEVGATVQLTATARDANGNVLTGRSIAWSSSNAQIASVDPSGVVLGVAVGAASITATSEGRSGTASADVRAPPVATVEIGPVPGPIIAGQSVQLTATARAANGTTIQGKTFAWSSSNAAILQVSNTGLATGVAPGQATVSASVDNVTGNLNVTVAPGDAVLIAQIAPATLVEGQPATITGSGFSTTPASNTVSIGGRPATVTQATATTLQVVVPAFDCRPAGNAAVQVTIGARASPVVQHPVSPATTLGLQVGELAVLRAPADLCLQFGPAAGAERYVFGVQSLSEVLNSLTPVRVAATVPGGAAGAQALAPVAAATAVGPWQPPSREDLELDRAWADHIAITEAQYARERPMLQRLADELRRSPPDRAASVPTVPGTVQEGNELTIRFPDFSGNTCTQSLNITVRVRRISNRAIIVEDVANPVSIDAASVQQAATEFDAAYALAVDHYGDPGDVDGNGRIVIVITREVNRLSTAPPLGFVAHANLFPVAQCPASNEGEFMWIRSPDPNGVLPAGVYTLDTLLSGLVRLLMHEFTHNIQGGQRMAAGGQFMVSWLAEGLAVSSEEVLGFHILGLQQGGNYGASTVYPTRGADPRFFFGYMGDPLAYFGFNYAGVRHAGAPEQCTWLGTTPGNTPGPCNPSNRIRYGVTWAIIKNAIDRLPGGAAANQKQVLRAFSAHVGPPGFADLEAAIGKPIATILAEFAPVLHLDDRYPAAGFQLANWNLRNIAAAWNSPNADLLPRMHGFAAFNDALSVRAGSSSYHEISGANRPAVAVSVRDDTGGTLPGIIQVWVVRVQ